ncbi:hypothetical protein NG895_12205 [Aeoliella sp. ICT_H6.2]|uniref:ABC exporter n=1 Tax=Aeoliella straminimaris TaxID=2954799 RepID=A0A9X2FHA9_9BACT|nr:hypothetical protein [Aeoliella straminimaris]MCO6044671.1 hypothetical protein [Aeoliella straminimaris]
MAIHPAVGQLLRLQLQARWRKMFAGIIKPRRVLLTLVAAVLLCFWLANAVASVLFRQSTDDESLRIYVAFALTAYTVWHVVRLACFQPAQPLEMPDSDRAVLEACPLTPSDLVGHHLAGTFCAAFIKSACVALLLLPDLRQPVLGFLGILIALWVVDLLRIALEITTWGMSRRVYLSFRTIVLASLAAACFLAAGTVREAAVDALAVASESNPFESIQVFFGHLQNTTAAAWCTWCWQWVLEVVTAKGFSSTSLLWLLAATTMVVSMAACIFRLYNHVMRVVALREQREYAATLQKVGRLHTSSPAALLSSYVRFRVPPRLTGIGPLVWRQTLGASRYAGGLCTAMAVPAALAMVPLFAPVTSEAAFLSVVGGLAFYTFLLLPTALKFDFRRDLDRIAMIKALPVSSLGTAIGQVATPVMMATLFQVLVIAIACFVRPVPTVVLAGSVCMLFLMNLFIFALENLIFMWYPYRLQQEGLEIFLRTTLVFTAKGLLFAAALAVVVALTIPARFVADFASDSLGIAVSGYVVYFVGIQLLMLTAGGSLLCLLARAFASFDPSQDQV